MNMILHNAPTAVIEQGNTLANPKFKVGDTLKTFDKSSPIRPSAIRAGPTASTWPTTPISASNPSARRPPARATTIGGPGRQRSSRPGARGALRQRGFVPGIGAPRNRAGANVHLGESGPRNLGCVSDAFGLDAFGLNVNAQPTARLRGACGRRQPGGHLSDSRQRFSSPILVTDFRHPRRS